MLQCVAARCSVLHCVVVCCSVLQCVTVCTLHRASTKKLLQTSSESSELTCENVYKDCALVYYSVLRCFAVCGSVWQCVVVCGSVLKCVGGYSVVSLLRMCSRIVRWCVAVCCSVWQCVKV